MVVDEAAKWCMAVCAGDDMPGVIARWEGVPGTAWAHPAACREKDFVV
jgi:hypothetical protein